MTQHCLASFAKQTVKSDGTSSFHYSNLFINETYKQKSSLSEGQAYTQTQRAKAISARGFGAAQVPHQLTHFTQPKLASELSHSVHLSKNNITNTQVSNRVTGLTVRRWYWIQNTEIGFNAIFVPHMDTKILLLFSNKKGFPKETWKLIPLLNGVWNVAKYLMILFNCWQCWEGGGARGGEDIFHGG